MLRTRIIYIASLVFLGVLLVFAVFRPMTTLEKFSTVSRESVIQGEDEWIIQFDLINIERIIIRHRKEPDVFGAVFPVFFRPASLFPLPGNTIPDNKMLCAYLMNSRR